MLHLFLTCLSYFLPTNYRFTGTQELEEERLLDYLLFPQTECTYQRFLGQTVTNNIHFSASHPQDLPVCAHSKQEIFHRPCTVFRFRYMV